jgi:uncharacterized protein with NRDE domain
VCTVLLRLDPMSAWPVVLGAIRDEFVARAWDPPAAHWPEPWTRFVGGRDRTAGGTWLAVDPAPDRPAVAALLNGYPRDPAGERPVRPTRGELVLRALAGDGVPEGEALAAYDRFHLLLATVDDVELWTWDAEQLVHQRLVGRAHIVVNAGLDAADDPLVPHFTPLLEELDAPHLDGGSWGGWPELLSGDGLAGDDDRALIVRKEIEGRAYGSTSGSLVALGRDGRVRYAFTPTPADPGSWSTVPVI